MNYRHVVLVCLITVFSIGISNINAKEISNTNTKESLVDSSEIYKKRLRYAVGIQTGGYLVTMTGLSILWYKDYPITSFHFFNDNAGWNYMDKFGHLTTAYHTGSACINMLEWAGVERKKAIWYGGTYGLAFLTSVEILDGFSAKWGASPIDLLSNTLGSAMAIGQELAWSEQRVIMKFSYQNSPYAKYQPDKLGESWEESWLKDYNGQTYWLSANIKSFLSEDVKFPNWLNLSVGYGAEGMVTGFGVQQVEYNNQIFVFNDYKQFYLAPDIDLTKIKTNSRLLKTALKIVGWIKFPTPTIEYNKNEGFVWHWIFF